MKEGYLTPGIITRALDAAWQVRHGYLPSPRNSEGALIYPGNLNPLPLGVPELDWTVQAGGWRLVIADGAIRGLEECPDECGWG